MSGAHRSRSGGWAGIPSTTTTTTSAVGGAKLSTGKRGVALSSLSSFRSVLGREPRPATGRRSTSRPATCPSGRRSAFSLSRLAKARDGRFEVRAAVGDGARAMCQLTIRANAAPRRRQNGQPLTNRLASLQLVERPGLVVVGDRPSYISGDLLSLLQQLQVGGVAIRVVEQLQTGLDVARCIDVA